MESIAVNIENLSFHYPGQTEKIIDAFSLQIKRGERFGLFGPNGAGKTTLMSLMTGLLIANKGHIRLFDQELQRHHKEINKLFGFVPQNFSFFNDLTPEENLEFFGAWSGLTRKQIRERTDEVMEVLNLNGVRKKQVGKFSGGMKRRVNLAIGVIHHPRILFLDEPTVGVDAQTRHEIIQYLRKLNSIGTTLFYTSHQLQEAEELCDRVALINDGKIIVDDQLNNLLSMHGENSLESLFLKLTKKSQNINV